MNKYLVCGIPISDTGVGRLMRKIAPEAESRGYVVITPSRDSIKMLLQDRQYHKIFVEILERSIGKLLFKLRLSRLKKSIILFIHPQVSGFKNLIRLIENNRVYLYVMDNSFFCIRSYNLDPYSNSECLRCIGSPENVLKDCYPYPYSYSREENYFYLESLKMLSSRLVFLAQNENQKILLEAHFGKNIDCIIVGLDTGEIPLDDEPISTKTNEMNLVDKSLKFDIVYHGSNQIAKGISYIVDLAQSLNEFSFFVPESKENCELTLGYPIECENISFKACRWESGLKEAVSQARLVINPSLWSASIEGALLKSIFYGSKVATVKTLYGFEGEISKHIDLIRLPQDVNIAAAALREILNIDSPIDECAHARSILIKLLREKSIFGAIEKHLAENPLF